MIIPRVLGLKICFLFSPDTLTVLLVRQTPVDSIHAEAGRILPLHFQELFVLWVLHDREGIFPGDVEELTEIALGQRSCYEFAAFRPLQSAFAQVTMLVK